jgi:hypothetical protein
MTRFITTVKGKRNEWIVEVAECSVEDMRQDGIEVVEVAHVIPAWVAEIGLERVWILGQGLWDAPTRIWRRWRK